MNNKMGIILLSLMIFIILLLACFSIYYQYKNENVLDKAKISYDQETINAILKYNPFNEPKLYNYGTLEWSGIRRGIIIDVNTAHLYIINGKPKPEINEHEMLDLKKSKNWLRELFAETPSKVDFIIYIRHEFDKLGEYLPESYNPILSDKIKITGPAGYQYIDKIAILDWKNKHMVAYQEFKGEQPPKKIPTTEYEATHYGYKIGISPNEVKEEEWINSIIRK